MEQHRPLGRGLEDVSRVFLSQGAEEPAPPPPLPPEPAGPKRTARPLPRDQSVASPTLLRPVERVTRPQVVAALREYEGALEEGLRGIASDVPCGACGAIDLLAIDRASQLAIVDFDTEPGDELLVRGLSHADWVIENVPNLRNMFRGLAINFSLAPRLFLLAPRFSTRMMSAARQIERIRIDWIRYQVVESPGGTGILFERAVADPSA
jgi:hypothetical protein